MTADSPGTATRWVRVGRIRGLFGVRGEARVESLTSDPLTLADFPTLWLDPPPGGGTLSPLAGRLQGPGLVMAFAGVDRREDVTALLNRDLYVPRDQLPLSDEDGLLWADLVGLQVADEAGVSLGRVVGLMETGANDVLVLHGPGGERLLPYIDDVVRRVDLDAGVMVVRLLPGM
ncbi:MAG: ribosome maturation factor RimM [Magnetococcus sp. WYHC-3]